MLAFGRATWLATTCLASCCIAKHAYAQTATGDQQSAQQPQQDSASESANVDGKIGDIIVTAERKVENLQKTPAQVTVISGDTIRSGGLTNVEQILRTTPGVTINKTGNGLVVNLRGEGTDTPSGFGQGAVAMEFDGVYHFLNEAGLLGYFDVKRVEVLPGPQGTLYGVNADAGVVNVITNDPVIGRVEGNVNANIGNYHTYSGQAAINIPISSILAVRVAGEAYHRDSYFTPETGTTEHQAARVKVLFEPTPDIALRLTYNFAHTGGSGDNGGTNAFAGDSINDQKNPWGTPQDSTSGPRFADSHLAFYSHELVGDARINVGSFATLNVISTWQHAREDQNRCGPERGSTGPGACQLGFPYTPFRQYTDEVRLNSQAGSAFQWGIGYYHFNYRQDQIPFVGAGTSIIGGKSDAGFGNVSFTVLPKLRLIAGARLNYDSRYKNNNGGPIYSADSHHFDYRVGAQYDFAPNSMEYFTVSTGYRPGGVNTQINNALTFYKNETVTSFEIGSKNRFLNDTLQVNVAAYYTDQKNYQLFDYVGVDACRTQAAQSLPSCQPQLLNLQGRIFGLEADVRWNFTADDRFVFTTSLLNGRFKKKQNAPCLNTDVLAPGSGYPYQTVCYIGSNLPDNTPFFLPLTKQDEPHAPAIAINGSYDHIWRLANGSSFDTGLQVFYTTKYYVAPVVSVYTLQPAYWNVGASVSYHPASDRWSLSAYIHNMANYAVKNSTGNSYALGEPRTFGVSGQYHF